MIKETRYTVYNGNEYVVLRYRDGNAKLIDEHCTGTLKDDSGKSVGFRYIPISELSDVYIKRVYGIVDGYSVKILDDTDFLNYYVEVTSASAARALSLVYHKDDLYRGYVEKCRVKTKQIKIKVRS